MEKTPYQIYDIIFKKILTLSSTAVIHLINGLFNTDYASDSSIQYNWTEFTDDRLRRVLADTIITINGRHSYHMEAQMTEDDDIIFRVFDYGLGHARQNSIHSKDTYILKFPEPKIIYLYYNHPVPDEYVLTLDFGSQGTFNYHVSTFKFLDVTIDELLQKKLIILIPFALLKLRKAVEKERTPENLNALKTLIQNDIMKSIDVNELAGNITSSDAGKLRSLTHKLYEHIYSHYSEMKELNDMTDETILLDIDILEKQIEEQLDRITQLNDEVAQRNDEIAQQEAELARINDTLSQKDMELSKMNDSLSQKDMEISQMNDSLSQKDMEISQMNDSLSQKDMEISCLKKQLEALQTK